MVAASSSGVNPEGPVQDSTAHHGVPSQAARVEELRDKVSLAMFKAARDQSRLVRQQLVDRMEPVSAFYE